MYLYVGLCLVIFIISIDKICDKLENIETALLMQNMELKKIREGNE